MPTAAAAHRKSLFGYSGRTRKSLWGGRGVRDCYAPPTPWASVDQDPIRDITQQLRREREQAAHAERALRALLTDVDAGIAVASSPKGEDEADVLAIATLTPLLERVRLAAAYAFTHDVRGSGVPAAPAILRAVERALASSIGHAIANCERSRCEERLVALLQKISGYFQAYIDEDHAVLQPLFRAEGFDEAVAEIDRVAQACATSPSPCVPEAIRLTQKGLGLAMKAERGRKNLEKSVEALKDALKRKREQESRLAIDMAIQTVAPLSDLFIRYALLFGPPKCGILDPEKYALVKALLEREMACGPEAISQGHMAALAAAQASQAAETGAEAASRAVAAVIALTT